MRLTTEQVKQAILHPDKLCRTAAIYYFSQSYSSDPSIMLLAIEAFQQYGLDAFESYTFPWHLPQTRESLSWAIEEIERLPARRTEQEELYCDSLLGTLLHAAPYLLKEFEDAIQGMKNLDIAWKRALHDPIYLSTFNFDQLWKELLDYSANEDEEPETNVEDSYGRHVVDLLAHFPEQAAERVLAILSNENERGTLEVLSIRLAGKLKLEPAIPSLLDALDDLDTYAYAQAIWALARIGSDTVVQAIQNRAKDRELEFKLTAAEVLEHIHTDASMQTCLQWFEDAEDEHLRRSLLQSILANFDSAGIEPARQFLLSASKTPDSLEVRSDLLVACKLLDVVFPEFEEWLEDAKHDVEFRRKWYRTHPLLGADLADVSEDEESELYDDLDFDDYDPVESTTQRRERVGRNDPCPCGSGKKFKKCCYRKQPIEEDMGL